MSLIHSYPSNPPIIYRILSISLVPLPQDPNRRSTGSSSRPAPGPAAAISIRKALGGAPPRVRHG